MPPDALLVLIVVGIATYRIARAIAVDDITRPMREKIAYGTRTPSRLAELVLCPICVGFWVGMTLGLGYGYWLTDWSWPHVWLVALAAVGLGCFLSVADSRMEHG